MLNNVFHYRTTKLEEFKADLNDIETSALELSTGNYEANEYEKDCQHIANLAKQLQNKVNDLVGE